MPVCHCLRRSSAALIFLFLFALGGCSSSLDGDGGGGASSGGDGSTGNLPARDGSAFFDADGAAVQILNATDSEAWVYFDLDTFSVVTPVDPATDLSWDLAFQRFKIRLNGGESGPGGVETAVLHDTPLLSVTEAPDAVFVSDRSLTELTDEELLKLGSNIFFSVCAPGFDDESSADYCLADDTVDRDHLNEAEAAFAFLTLGSGVVIDEQGQDGDPILGWYDYFQYENHLLRPSDDTWIVRSTDGNEFAVQMLGYYGYEEGDAESGTLALRYVSLTPGHDISSPGAQQLAAIATANTNSGQGPLTVTFEGVATGVEGGAVFTWVFGDGSSATGPSVSHTYQMPGAFTATLTVTDDRGSTAAATDTIVITVTAPGNQLPVADAGSDQEIFLEPGQSQVSVELDGAASSDADGQIVEYNWTGSPDPDNVASPVVLLGAGSYAFTLAVTDDLGGVHSDVVIVTVNAADNVAPSAVASADKTFGPAPMTVWFDGLESSDADGAIVSWAWDFGDGSAESYDAQPVHEFTEAGVFTVTLVVTDDTGASATTSVIVETSLRVPAVQDTYVYEFLGNQGAPGGDSAGVLVWKHNSNHGSKGLIGFANAWLSSSVLAGDFTATLYLYAGNGKSEDSSGFVGANPGEPDADNPFTPGIATVKVDILPQPGTWEEGGEIDWGAITEDDASRSVLTLDGVGRWSEVNITEIVRGWWAGGSVGGGLAISQEAYPVIRADNGAIPVAAFCDTESSRAVCSGFDSAPYIEIRVAP